MSFQYVYPNNFPKIELYNVKHGDFGIYFNENYQCFLDFGSLQKERPLNIDNTETPLNIFNTIIASQPDNNERDLLVSHYHKDHFNFIDNLIRPQFFRRLYVPQIDLTEKSNRGMLYSEYLITYIDLKYNTGKKDSFIDLISGKHYSDFCPLWEGKTLPDIIDKSGNKAQILWPPRNYKTKVKFWRLAKGLEKKLKKNDYNKNDLNSLWDFFNEYYPNRIYNKNEDIEIYKKVINSSEYKNRYNELITNIPKDRDKKFELTPELEEYSKELRNKLKNYLDSFSIAMKLGNKILLTGDIKDQNILRHINNKISNSMEFIKIPHHGTVDISQLKRSKNYIASLSEIYDPIHKNNLRIINSNNTISTLYCTDCRINCSTCKHALNPNSNYFPRNYKIDIIF